MCTIVMTDRHCDTRGRGAVSGPSIGMPCRTNQISFAAPGDALTSSKPRTSDGLVLSRPAPCRSDVSCRFIRLTSPFTEAKRNPCSGSAVRQSSCSAKRTRGAQRRTLSKTHGRESRRSYGSAMRSRGVDRLSEVVPVRLVQRMTSPTGGPVRPPRPCPHLLKNYPCGWARFSAKLVAERFAVSRDKLSIRFFRSVRSQAPRVFMRLPILLPD